MNKFPIEEFSVDELAKIAKGLENLEDMTEEEEIENDAEGGYFQEEDD